MGYNHLTVLLLLTKFLFVDAKRSTGHKIAAGVAVSVDSFGAKANGKDDSEAFKRAWREVCSSEGGILVVPRNKIYRLKPTTFSGSCRSNPVIRILGTVKAFPDPSVYYKGEGKYWLLFYGIQDLIVEGGGIVDGNGNMWWHNSCKVDITRPCKHAPTAVTFLECVNVRVDGLEIRNAQQMHLSFQGCTNVVASNLRVIAPATSPNTDGIHITNSRMVQIKRSFVATGDDCISIVSGTIGVVITDITCGPGHGISIGSLGEGNSMAYVSDVVVNRAMLSGTTNGLRIKTWQGGRGYARNIIFKNVVMRNVSNPIIIDQNYCDREMPCDVKESAVQVRNVVYKNIRGTSATENAVRFDCSKNTTCQQIVLENIHLVSQLHRVSKAVCFNAHPSYVHHVIPSCS